MRRVVVTGMGIVSSIGNNCAEALESLREARSGITFSSVQAEMGFRSHVVGAPTLDPETVLDRRAMRFHGLGSAWNHVAMEQAIADAGLGPDEISHERTGIIMGSGGPSTRTIVEAADTARSRGVKKIGPFAVPKAMSSTSSATLATWFKIKGINYSIASACATLRAKARSAACGRRSRASTRRSTTSIRTPLRRRKATRRRSRRCARCSVPATRVRRSRRPSR